MATNEELRVSPAELRKYASEMEKIYKVYVTLISQADDEMKKLKPIWTGAAAEQYTTTFNKAKTICSEYIETLKLTITSLNESADNYDRNIQQIKSAADELPRLSGNTMR